jgi:hypothetical protein
MKEVAMVTASLETTPSVHLVSVALVLAMKPITDLPLWEESW